MTDKETGRFDIDLLTTGQSTSQLNKIKNVLGIIENLGREHDKVLTEMVVDEAKKQGIDAEKAREIISKLKRDGDVYEPRHGELKRTPRNY